MEKRSNFRGEPTYGTGERVRDHRQWDAGPRVQNDNSREREVGGGRGPRGAERQVGDRGTGLDAVFSGKVRWTSKQLPSSTYSTCSPWTSAGLRSVTSPQ